MKKFIVVAMCFSWSFLKAQVFPMVDGKAVYEQIDSVTASKNELFIRSKIWLVNTFKSSKDVIQLDDKESGKLMGKGMSMFAVEYGFNKMLISGAIYYTIQIDCRDNNARIKIYDIQQGNEQGVSIPVEASQYW